MRKVFFLFNFIFAFIAIVSAQNKEVIQFSGVVVTPDSLIGIPYVNIYENSTKKGTVSNHEGFFSFAAETGDTINFSSIGFKKSTFIIPSTLESNKYSVVKFMVTDTAYIDSVVIYPWPTKDALRMAFLELEFEESDIDRAMRNLEREYLKEIGETMAYDADENVDYYMRQEAQKFYWAGQAPPQNIFNLFAWAKFIEAWKRGDFKLKKKN
ncbi:MAG: carboxypeptidase-like regulatory domain-containing protein [Chitinophagales bacterium]